MFRGVPLKNFAGSGDWLGLCCRVLADDRIEVELHDAHDPRIRHYAAVIDLGDTAATSSPAAPREIELAGYDQPIYGDALFHGPQFQVIRSVDGVGVDGIAGQLSGTLKQHWTGGPWQTDVAALDGGLQLALLWAGHCLGGRSLPTGLGAYRSFSDQLVEGPLQCTVVGHSEGSSKSVCDITFADHQGRVVAKLDGVELHRRP
jgi:hypothetical protein